MLSRWKSQILIFLFILASYIESSWTFATFDHSKGNSRQRRAIVSVPETYDLNDFPPDEAPKAVHISVLIFTVDGIKEIAEEISIEMNLRLVWRDERLIDWVASLQNTTTPANNYILVHPSVKDKIWVPDVYFDHLKRIDQPAVLAKPTSLRMYGDCSFRYSARVTIAVSCPMDFHYYPADTQRCDFDLKSYGHTEDKLKLIWRENYGANFAYPVDLQNYYVGLDNQKQFVAKTLSGRTYSGLRYTIILTRKLSYHMLQTFLPSIVLVVVSWLSFLISLDAVPARAAVVMTCLLTLISMFSSVRQSTPNVSYVKAMDIWMVVCVFFVFSTLLEFTVALKIRAKKLKPKVQTKNLLIIEDSEIGKTKLEGGPSFGKNIPPGQPSPSDLRSKNEEIVQKLEFISSIGIPALFLLFNIIFWPWLIIGSQYNSHIDDTTRIDTEKVELFTNNNNNKFD